jgi:sensor histidine kinase YesM
MVTISQDTSAPESAHRLLAAERDRAERLLNRVRLSVLVLLGVAAAFYAAALPTSLNRVNLALLAPMLAWTVGQQLLFYHRPTLPAWLTVANPIVDLTALTLLLLSYGLAYSPELALKTPIVAGYFLILAALPVASSTRKAAAVSALALLEYLGLLAAFNHAQGLTTVMSPVLASSTAAVSPLDEGAKIMLLACAGAVATYATRWQERLALSYSAAARARERLQVQLDQAQLQALKLQLQPHFLFNTLNTITALVHRDPEAAERMISGLSELLRFSLGPAGDQEVPLARELEMLRHYLDIQQVRFQDRLSVGFEVEADVQQAVVPSMLLQPLVENAIQHGIAPRAAGGRIVIAARRRQERLVLEVLDDGVGGSRGVPLREGVGLGNARARLRSLYGAAHVFSAAPRPEGGFCVYIELPFRLHVPRPREAA